MRHPPFPPERMKFQPRRWHLSSFWTSGRLWTLRVCKVGKDWVRRQSEQRHKMKMLFVFRVANKHCIEYNL